MACGWAAGRFAVTAGLLADLRRQPYDVLLLDVQMPEMDGLEATRAILDEWPRERRPRIVAMTAYAMAGDKEKFLAAGMSGYVAKPVNMEILMQVMSETLAEQQR